MATSTVSAGLARVFSIFSPSSKAITADNALKMVAPRTIPEHTSTMHAPASMWQTTTADNLINSPGPHTFPRPEGNMQYSSASPMQAIPPTEIKPKAALATKQPATQDTTMEVRAEDLEGQKPVLNMRGGIDHDHHGTRVCHDIFCCFICCDCMDDCCTAIDDTICCE